MRSGASSVFTHIDLMIWLDALDASRLVAAATVIALYAASTLWFTRTLWRPVTAHLATTDDASARLLLVYASQTGFAEQLARQTAASLTTTGAQVDVVSLAHVNATHLTTHRQALFIVSTTGEGDAPDPAIAFVRNTLSSTAELSALHYGVLALGDREYHNYCAFGHQLDGWLRQNGGKPLFDVVEVDNGDEGALRHWQHQLGVLTGSPDLPDWETPRYDRWTLTERTLVNPGSAGDPCFHLALKPEPDAAAQWQAGDIVEIDPHNSSWQTDREALAHREYSIASVPADGAVHLLVRQMRRPDGSPGLGSGWLTHDVQVGSTVAMRIRANANFHAPTLPCDLILIGNGTGLAGLRALLKARETLDAQRNWLIFGERNEAHDLFYRHDLTRWQQTAQLQLDLVFSRDQPERRYVQHRLLERADELRRWIDAGAAIYVCGSLQGMAPGVDAALTEILGTDLLTQLTIDGRYKRDVY